MFKRYRLYTLVAIIVSIVLSSCAEKAACNVRLNKKKFKYYNSLQFGGGTKRR